ncbi:AAA domain containing protein [uncultured Caudovirales phage]|uniref:AAA domain containing protein n=1 Tax=uncultured Caudovirales phage TaxID=2100421 RepID=A0A6J5KVR8_9CAUD|nr:AAA domain containing protein [uncultured Caudovirales phage]
MNLTSVARNAKSFYQSAACYYFTSRPGMGKTTTVEACVPIIARALDLNLGFVLINAPLLTPADAVGYLVPKHHDDGRVESLYTDPFWWITSEGKRLEEYDGGILFIDELDKADVDVKKVLGEMAETGRCGPHRLPAGWVVWAAGNRSQDRSGSTKELDHLINRRIEIEITDDIGAWETWSLKNGVHPAIVTFGVQNPHLVFQSEMPEKQGPFCSPRSLVKVGKVLACMADDKGLLPTDSDAIEIAGGAIGKPAAAQLFATLRLQAEMPPLESIIAAPDKVRVPDAPDAQMLICYNLAHRVDAANMGQLIKYIDRMPADFAITFAKAVVARLPAFVARPEMLDWAKRNNSLMTTLAVLK